MRVIVSAILVVFFATGAMAQMTTQNVEDNWAWSSFRWTSLDQMMVRYSFYEKEGSVGVCLAYASRGGRAFRFNKAALKEAKLTLNGEAILRDLRFAASHSSRAFPSALVGYEANCLLTKTKAPANGGKVRLEWRSGKYRLDG